VWRRVRVLFACGLAAGVCAAASGGRALGNLSSPGAHATLQTLVRVQYAPLSVTTASLPPGARGVAYPSVTLTATGGLTPYTWSLVAGTLPPGMQLQPDGLLTGRPAAATNPILTFRVQDSENPSQEVTKVLTILVTVPGVRVMASSTGTSSGGAAEVRVGGTGGSTPETVAAATGGSGSVSVAEYSGNPAPTDPALEDAGSFFDVALSPGATFTRLTIERCGIAPSGVAYWWSAQGRRWVPVSDQSFDAATGCLIILVTATTSPSLVDLVGTYLTVGAPIPYNRPAAEQPAVGSGGGLLGTADGAFRMAIPAGALAGGDLQVAEAPAPSALPPNTAPASPLFVLSGQSLVQSLPATIGYDPVALQGLSPEHLCVYAQQPGGTWTAVPTAVDRVDGTVEVPVAGPETLVVLADLRTFGDVPAGYWAAGAIDGLVAAGAAVGFPDGTFRPEAPVTRAEFVKMLDLVLGLAPGVAGGSGGFVDVPAGAWFQPWVAAARGAGIVQGESPTLFAPNRPVTRQEMATLLARALDLHGGDAASLPFTDSAAIAPWAVPAVGAAVATGYFAGFPDGTLRPHDAATRAQAAAVLALVLLHRAGALP